MLTIGKLAKRSGVPPSTLRYYESEGLLIPAERSDAGYRLYAEEQEQTLRFIQRAQRLGFTLDDIRLLLRRIDNGNLAHGEINRIAEARYLEIERRVTELLVQRHEMGLFLQDLHRRMQTASAGALTDEQEVADALFTRLVERVCTDPGAESAASMLEWLLHTTGCPLTTQEAYRLLEQLRGEHVHLWQADDGYYILVVSDNPATGDALTALAQLEADCRVHRHARQIPQVMHNDEGYLLVARGDNAFIFARLFLTITA